MSENLPLPIPASIVVTGVQMYDVAEDHYVTLAAKPVLTSNTTYYFPNDGISGQCLSTNGAGLLSWRTVLSSSGAVSIVGQVPQIADTTTSSIAPSNILITNSGNDLTVPGTIHLTTSTGFTNTAAIINYTNSPTNASELVTKQYVDTTASGITVLPACVVVTVSNLTAIYNNGASGVGATLTNTGALAAFSADSYSPSATSRILVTGQSSTLQNGVYTLTTVGDGATPWVLTRATDYNTPAQISPGDQVVITNGTVYNGSTWIETATVAAIGTDPILFTRQNPFAGVTAGNGITIATNVISTNINTTNLQYSATQINTIQDISTSSSPSFAGLTTATFQITTSPTSGYFLKSDASGNGTWSSLTSSAVTALTGTTNQITASASVGAVTLSLPNGVSLGSYQATSPPTGGMIAPGHIGVGTNAPNANSTASLSATQSNDAIGLYITGTSTSTSVDNIGLSIDRIASFSASNSLLLQGINVSPTFKTSTGTLSGTCAGISVANILTGNAGTINTVYGLIINSGSAAGTVSSGYGVSIAMPAYGTNKYGANITGSATATSSNVLMGLDIDASLGSSSGTLTNCNHVYIYPSHAANAGTITNAYGFYIDSGSTAGTITNGYSSYINMPSYGSSRYGTYVAGSTTVATGSTLSGLHIIPSLGSSSGTLANCNHVYIYPNLSANAATITTAAGLYIDSGSTAGTVTNGYGFYVANPAYGTTKTAIYADNLSIGYTAVTPPTNGVVVNGRSSFGSNAADSNTTLKVSIDQNNDALGIYCTGTSTSTATNHSGIYISCVSSFSASNSLTLQGIGIAPTFKTSSGTLSGDCSGIAINNVLTGNAGTISSVFGMIIYSGSTAGTVTNGYGLYVQHPAYGTTKYTAVFEGPTMISSTIAGTTLNVGTYSTSYYGIRCRPTFTVTDTGTAAGGMRGLDLIPTFQHTSPSSGSGCITLVVGGIYNALTSGTLDNTYGIYITNSFTGNTQTITNYNGIYYDGGGSASGTITNAYACQLNMPAAGINRYGLLIGGTASVTSSGNINAFQVVSSIGCSSGTASSFSHSYFHPSFSANSATITTAYGIYVTSGATAGTITNGYNLLVNMPSYGSTIKRGIVLTGTATVASTGNLTGVDLAPDLGCSSGTLNNCIVQYIYPSFAANSATITSAYGLVIANGTSTGTITTGYSLSIAMPAYGSSRRGFLLSGTATVASTGTLVCMDLSPSLGCSSGTLADSEVLYIYPNFSANSATITAAYGLFISPGAAGAGTITGGTSLYVGTPAYGTNKYCALFAGHILPAADNTYSCGTSTNRWSVIYAATGTINTSDRNAKDEIQPETLGLGFINQLLPVTYRWKDSIEYDFADDKKEKPISNTHVRRHHGLIAQDVKEVLDRNNISANEAAFWTDSNINDPGVNRQGLIYTEFIPILIKATQELDSHVQELNAKNNELNVKNIELQTQNTELNTKVTDLSTQLTNLIMKLTEKNII